MGGGIMFLLFVSVSNPTVPVFSRRFGNLSGLISFASVLTFAAHVFLLEAHRAFVVFQCILVMVNVFILYPLWFISLSRMLPEAVAALTAANIGESFRKEEEAVVP